LFPAHVHRFIFLFGLCGLAFGMMIGTVPTTVPQVILASNWLLEGDFGRKMRVIRSHRIFWVLSSVFLLHALGLLWTTDLPSGAFDVRTKVPLMFLPMVLFTTNAPTAYEFRLVLRCFVVGCVVSLTWCLLYAYALHPGGAIRNVSRFMSHIRFGLYLNMGITACIWLSIEAANAIQRWGLFALAAFFLAGMLVLGLATGLIAFAFLFVFFGVWLTFQQKGFAKYVALATICLLTSVGILAVKNIATRQLTPVESSVNSPAHSSSGGNLYIHFDSLGQKENGYYVLMNIQLEELQRAWKRDFPADSFSYDAAHNLGRYEVLVRYMASKGLFKDSAGYAALDNEDKENVRKGITNHLYPQWSRVRQRVYELVNEYDEYAQGRQVSGHSITMRLYFWKAAVIGISSSPLTGVGTGDVQQTLNDIYEGHEMPLSIDWYKRPHNQYLTVALSLGIPAMLWFVFALLYPALSLRRSLPLLYWPFLMLAAGSFFFEDTLETQAGVTFFAFFNTFFIAAKNRLGSSLTA
jgi:hypothetical protein